MLALPDIAPSMSLIFVDILVPARNDTLIFGVHSFFSRIRMSVRIIY